MSGLFWRGTWILWLGAVLQVALGCYLTLRGGPLDWVGAPMGVLFGACMVALALCAGDDW